MPDLHDRDDLEQRLARAMRKANAEQRRRLLDALGDPPDPERVPETLWLELEREQSAIVRNAVLLAGLTAAAILAARIARSIGQELRHEQLVRDVEAVLTQRIQWLSASYTRNTRRQMRRAWAESQAVAIDPTAGGVVAPAARRTTARRAREILAEILSDDRADTVATTEVTAAQTAGEGAGRARLPQDVPGAPGILGVWRHRARLVRGAHPCPLCAPLVGTDQTEWAGINPLAFRGPPLHPRCDCTVEYVLISDEENQRIAMASTLPTNWDVPYRDHFRRLRDSRSPADRK